MALSFDYQTWAMEEMEFGLLMDSNLRIPFVPNGKEVLGLEPHSVRENFIAFRWKINDQEIRFSIGTHSSVKGRNTDRFRFMTNFDVDDIKQISSSLKSKGVEFLREPEQEHWGGWVATFEDPDGNILQLIEQPPERR